MSRNEPTSQQTPTTDTTLATSIAAAIELLHFTDKTAQSVGAQGQAIHALVEKLFQTNPNLTAYMQHCSATAQGQSVQPALSMQPMDVDLLITQLDIVARQGKLLLMLNMLSTEAFAALKQTIDAKIQAQSHVTAVPSAAAVSTTDVSHYSTRNYYYTGIDATNLLFGYPRYPSTTVVVVNNGVGASSTTVVHSATRSPGLMDCCCGPGCKCDKCNGCCDNPVIDCLSGAGRLLANCFSTLFGAMKNCCSSCGNCDCTCAKGACDTVKSCATCCSDGECCKCAGEVVKGAASLIK